MAEGEGQQPWMGVWLPAPCGVGGGGRELQQGKEVAGSIAEDGGPLEMLCCSRGFWNSRFDFPLLGHVLYMSACSTQ